MKNFIVGLLLAAIVLVAVPFLSKVHLSSFVNAEGLLVVIGGTIAVMVLNSRFRDLRFLVKHFLRLLSIDDSLGALKASLMQCTKTFERGATPQATGNDSIDRSIEWISTGLRDQDLDRLLAERMNAELDQLYRCASILQNLSKYPPALGMIGTVIGIISIFQGLGQEGGQALLGQNLAIAMSSTLYGLTLANFIINPIAELFIQSIQKREEELNLIVETAKLWARRENSIYIQEHIELHDIA